MEFNAPGCVIWFSIAGAAGIDVRGLSSERAAAESVRAVRGLFAKVGLPRRLSEMGIKFKPEPKMVGDVLASSSAKNNPRTADKEQIAALFASVE